jgi:alpha-L-fucosidase 2
MNKIHSYFVLLMLILSASVMSAQDYYTGISEAINVKKFDPATFMWYSKPASKWEEALPVGNGRLGAMVFGKSGEEQIQLNEDTYWTGGPYSTTVKGGYEMLPAIQKLVFEGKYSEAQNLIGRFLMGYPVEQQKYQSLGDLHLFFNEKSSPVNYKRWLDLETGVAGVEYKIDGITFRRLVFVSPADQCVVIRITADQPGAVSFKANLRGARNQAHSNYATDYFRMDGKSPDQLVLSGKSADYLGVDGKLRYEVVLKAFNEGGNVIIEGKDLMVDKADAVTLCLVAATNFVNYKDVTGDQHQRVLAYLMNIATKEFSELYKRSVTDHSALFKRVDMHFITEESSYQPTDERITSFVSKSDPELAALVYQFGRYLMICSSRKGTQPANLQGIWNNNMNPNWDSKYTTNINTEMNYWIAESGNLQECAEPLFRMINELTDYGSDVAKENYGSKGWVFHQNTDLWRVAAPMDGPTWGTFTTGGAWLTTHLWEHYLFTKDIRFLGEYYPVIRGAVEFFLGFLTPHPNGKWLVTNPSTSPENFPLRIGNERYFDEITGSFIPGTSVCAGSTIDMQLIKDLFTYYIAAATILNLDTALVSQVKSAACRLVPDLVGKDGSLQEWTDDWGQMEKEHRHISHLYGLYPGNQISPEKTPELIEAVKRVLEQRKDGGAGWTRAWKMSCWARLYDGERALAVFKKNLKEQSLPQLFSLCFSAMQVDGSFGNAAGISEMLIQSHDGFINLLPALPAEWSSGKIKGMRARGGFEISMEWKDNRITSAAISSLAGGKLRINAEKNINVYCNGKRIKSFMTNQGITEIETIAGQTYTYMVSKN